IEVFFFGLPRKLSVVVIASIRSPELHRAKQGDLAKRSRQSALLQGSRSIQQNSRYCVAQKICPTHMDLWHDALQRNRFPLIAPAHLPPTFLVDVLNHRIGYVADLVPLLDEELTQRHVLKPCHVLVKTKSAPG